MAFPKPPPKPNAQRSLWPIGPRRYTIDTPTSRLQGPVGMALHGVGEMTCTLGEVPSAAI